MDRPRAASAFVLSLFLVLNLKIGASATDLSSGAQLAVWPSEWCAVAHPRTPGEHLARRDRTQGTPAHADHPQSDSPAASDGGKASTCEPGWALECGGTDAWSNDGAGSTDSVPDYSCVPWPESGPEFTYSFVSPATTQVTVELTNLSADLDLFVLTAPGGVCSGSNCDAFSTSSGLAPETVSFTASGGDEYFFVVDGYADSVGSYQVAVTCTPACAPAWEIRCGASDSWANDQAGSTNTMTDYACVPWAESGPEYAYRFSPTENVRVTIDLTGLSADLDLMVLSSPGGTCLGSNCVAASSISGTSPESVTFTATTGTAYAVVVDGYNGATSSYQVSVACRAVIFEDDFESGSVGAWTAHVP